MDEQSIRALLTRMSGAWNAGLADEVAACFCSDGRYLSSIGPNPGGRAVGRHAIRKLVADMMQTDGGVESATSDLAVFGSSAVWKWQYLHLDGRTSLGCDLFRFSDGLIQTKDAYRKATN